MKYLFINTAEKNSEIAFFSESKTFFYKSFPGTKKQSEMLLPNLKTSFDKIGAKFSEIDGLIVISGPGPFTGLRVGVTVANAICYTLNVPIYTLKLEKYKKLTDKANLLKSEVQKCFFKILPVKQIRKLSEQKIAIPFYDKEPNITLKP